MTPPLHFLSKAQELLQQDVTADCPKSNTGLSFVTLTCFMKFCMSNTKSSPVIHPDLFADPAQPSGPLAMK